MEIFTYKNTGKWKEEAVFKSPKKTANQLK